MLYRRPAGDQGDGLPLRRQRHRHEREHQLCGFREHPVSAEADHHTAGRAVDGVGEQVRPVVHQRERQRGDGPVTDAPVPLEGAARPSGRGDPGPGEPEDMVYARLATITDPFGVEFCGRPAPGEQLTRSSRVDAVVQVDVPTGGSFIA